ncbi:dihydroxyacetone kinase subunit DhaL [Enterococcus dongliensis]|uniref:phosphoenolpyruvate--glycerone phosphotransferase n=1 Tax=Enterococcus dongliensis TaxID=2559925 RepID=A0AAP5U1B4_9ENTE|nr:dihydroxyacetone kinase subunit DhaL [Enterococcus dongliensis]MDT2597314.1 dihydroxyacetone kinase subunit DhaL [Enterococcus dongliensis]MDT2604407.1 dihydroxyacetone kinase subunit DhaL [Enterococcus dongliensis]MDT2635183.1 dihydroxyacetone kinase subunit DhaL [Enterococcus dongliensis]MDT2637813.1 dihydroxyacetone kinase subunit DhaL [Enterococcus dongliensis]MDT2638515.1 dihydroxyacetone kinase subunit DhaL [Enterococcus dongliensis]
MFTPENLRKTLELFNEKVQIKKEYLSELDTPIGDGDHGNNMARGMTAVMAADLSGDLPDVFKAAAMALISKVGGASGPLYGTAMMEMMKASKDSSDPELLLKAAIAGIEKRGNSKAGEKTMLDLWVPAVENLNNGTLNPATIEILVEKTKNIKATKGRASYVGDRSIGHIDPGAMSSAYFFESMIEAGVFDE